MNNIVLLLKNFEFKEYEQIWLRLFFNREKSLISKKDFTDKLTIKRKELNDDEYCLEFEHYSDSLRLSVSFRNSDTYIEAKLDLTSKGDFFSNHQKLSKSEIDEIKNLLK